MGEMHASVAKLQELVAKMNAASGDAKIEQIAAIVNELVAQHTGMMQQMMSMHDGEMMQKMRTDRPSSGDATEASGTPDAEGDHSQHHPPEP